MLKWLHEQGNPWDAATCANAAERGHTELMQWAHYHGCAWQGPAETAQSDVTFNTFANLQFVSEMPKTARPLF